MIYEINFEVYKEKQIIRTFTMHKKTDYNFGLSMEELFKIVKFLKKYTNVKHDKDLVDITMSIYYFRNDDTKKLLFNKLYDTDEFLNRFMPCITDLIHFNNYH